MLFSARVDGIGPFSSSAELFTLTMKKSSVVEDDVQDDGIRAGAVVPLPHVGTHERRV